MPNKPVSPGNGCGQIEDPLATPLKFSLFIPEYMPNREQLQVFTVSQLGPRRDRTTTTVLRVIDPGSYSFGRVQE